MGVGGSLVLIAAGAILTWAVSAETSGTDLTAGGVGRPVAGRGRHRPPRGGRDPDDRGGCRPAAFARVLVELGWLRDAPQGRRERPRWDDRHGRARRLSDGAGEAG